MDFASLEGLDLSVEQSELAQVQGDLTVLHQYYDQIAAQGGICREQVQGLVRDCAVEIDPSFPIASFTEVPSKTNYAVAMEGMLSTAARTVWELIKKAAQLLIKIVRWVIEQIRNNIKNRHDAGKAVAAANALHDVNKQARARGIVSVVAKASGKAIVDRAQQEVDSARKSWDGNFNDLVFDMIGDQKFSQAVRFLAIDLLSYNELIQTKFEIFEELLDEEVVIGDQAKVMTMVGRLKTIAEPIPANSRLIGFAEAADVKIQRLYSGPVSIIELCTSMREHQKLLRFGKERPFVSAEEACDRLAVAEDGFVADFLQNPEKWTGVLMRIDHAISALGNAQPKGLTTADLQRNFAEAYDVLDREIKALQAFVVVTEACRAVRDQAAHDAFSFEVATLRKNKAVLEHSDEAELKAWYHELIQATKRALHGAF